LTTPPLLAAHYLPHRAPLLLVDTVHERSDRHLVTRLTVRDVAPFGLGDGRVPAYLGLEYMAQTVACFSGVQRVARGQRPIIGLLLGSRRYRAHTAFFADGQVLVVRAEERLSEYAQLNVFACRIESEDGSLLAEADLKAYQSEDPLALLQAAA